MLSGQKNVMVDPCLIYTPRTFYFTYNSMRVRYSSLKLKGSYSPYLSLSREVDIFFLPSLGRR